MMRRVFAAMAVLILEEVRGRGDNTGLDQRNAITQEIDLGDNSEGISLTLHYYHQASESSSRNEFHGELELEFTAQVSNIEFGFCLHKDLVFEDY